MRIHRKDVRASLDTSTATRFLSVEDFLRIWYGMWVQEAANLPSRIERRAMSNRKQTVAGFVVANRRGLGFCAGASTLTLLPDPELN